MSRTQRARSTVEKLAVFRACFTGLTSVYGTYDPRFGRVRQVKQVVTDEVLLRHLQGRQPYGVYLLVDDRTRAVAADFDHEDPWPALEFVRQAAHYGIQACLERSKRKGWHAWVFLELPNVLAAKARLVVKRILDDIERPATEVFPKQDRLTGTTCYGNFINAPLWGQLVPEGRTVFVDPRRSLKPYPDQWRVLEKVQRASERLLDEIIEASNLATPADEPVVVDRSTNRDGTGASFGLPPCAQRMLAQGVTEYQRVACFRLALHLKKAGVPRDVAVAGLTAWAVKNRPNDGRRVITPAEISEQTTHAYTRSYRGCGCEEPAMMPYCHPSCPLRKSAQADGKEAGP